MESRAGSIIVLSGGASSRFGADKSQAILGHQQLIHHILAGIPKEFEIIIVGADPLFTPASYRCVQESPAGGGPVAGIAAALELCESEIVGVLATDMPFAGAHMIHLLSAITSHDDAIMFVDSKGFKQPLAALYRREALENALSTIGNPHGASMRTLISHLKIHEVQMSPEIEKAMIDIDTPHDLMVAMEYLAKI
ncbi:MAG: molybdenum cofactor guanylyltransferase [Actinobacteria bacterium]|nr:molybdenum cofactor guanylyltransferase [Actinomycetota bacterium]